MKTVNSNSQTAGETSTTALTCTPTSLLLPLCLNYFWGNSSAKTWALPAQVNKKQDTEEHGDTPEQQHAHAQTTMVSLSSFIMSTLTCNKNQKREKSFQMLLNWSWGGTVRWLLMNHDRIRMKTSLLHADHLFIVPTFPHFCSIFLWLSNCRCVCAKQ